MCSIPNGENVLDARMSLAVKAVMKTAVRPAMMGLLLSIIDADVNKFIFTNRNN